MSMGTDYGFNTTGVPNMNASTERVLLPVLSEISWRQIAPPECPDVGASTVVIADETPASRRLPSQWAAMSAWIQDTVQRPVDPPDLAEAMEELEEVVNEAHDDGFPPPSDAVIGTARRLLREMYSMSPRPYSVYPTPDLEIAIHGQHANSGSILVLCESGGGALCLVSLRRPPRRARYADVNDLPDGFLREALRDLDRLAAHQVENP